jgi:hypothetical protein
MCNHCKWMKNSDLIKVQARTGTSEVQLSM